MSVWELYKIIDRSWDDNDEDGNHGENNDDEIMRIMRNCNIKNDDIYYHHLIFTIVTITDICALFPVHNDSTNGNDS